MAEAKAKSYNMRNPAVKRILQEVKEMAREESEEFMSMPLEEDIFEWQFAVHGPKDSEFEGGIYHGRITLPPEYPFKPPSFMLLTPSGRFEVQTKICLSISNHHPEHWQPSWSVRTALVALIAFMPTKPNGAIGSLEYTKKERRALAIKSRQQAPKFGSPERQSIIQQIHETMLKTAPSVPTTPLVEDDPSNPGGDEEGAPAALPAPAVAAAAAASQPKQPGTPEPAESATAGPSTPAMSREVQVSTGTIDAGKQAGLSGESSSGGTQEQPSGAVAVAAPSSSSPALEGASRELHSPGREAPAVVHDVPITWNTPANAASAAARQESETLQERILSVVAAVLVIAILVILGQKIANAYTGVAFAGSESEL